MSHNSHNTAVSNAISLESSDTLIDFMHNQTKKKEKICCGLKKMGEKGILTSQKCLFRPTLVGEREATCSTGFSYSQFSPIDVCIVQSYRAVNGIIKKIVQSRITNIFLKFFTRSYGI